MALDRWQQQLCDLLAAVQVKQRQYDQAVSACQLLLKPWPKKSQESEPTVKKDGPDSSNNAADAQVGPREVAELRVVNDLLKKAQKTRVKTSSQKLKQQVYPAGDDYLPASKSGKELWEICDTESQNIQESALKRDEESSDLKAAAVIKTNDSKTSEGLRNHTGVVQSERSTKNAVRKQDPKIQPARERGDQSSRSVGERRSTVSNVRKPSTTNVDPRRPKSLESKETSRPPSRPRSGRGRFQPAHAVAPFKTDPTLHVPKRSVKNSIRPVLKQQHPAGKEQNYTGDRNYMSKALPPIAPDKDLSPALVSSAQGEGDVQNCDAHSGLPDGEPQPAVARQSSSVCEEANSQLSSAHQASSGCEGTLNKLSGLTLEADSPQDVSSHLSDVTAKAACAEGSDSKPMEKQEVKLFSLLTEGASISIPPKVRRAFAKNQQLRKKVSQHGVGNKAKSTASDLGLKFTDQLQQLFEPEEELLYRQQALECLHTHQQLLQLLTRLDLDNVTETSSAEDVLRAKTLAEFVLSSFSELTEEANMLSRVRFPDTPAVVEPTFTQAGHPYLWLPASLQGQSLCSADRLLYRSKKDLNQYMNEMLRLQTLHCQRHLLDILVSDVLPWLQQQDCYQKDFSTIFRGLFSLLTSDGNHQPVLIRDL